MKFPAECRTTALILAGFSVCIFAPEMEAMNKPPLIGFFGGVIIFLLTLCIADVFYDRSMGFVGLINEFYAKLKADHKQLIALDTEISFKAWVDQRLVEFAVHTLNANTERAPAAPRIAEALFRLAVQPAQKDSSIFTRSLTGAPAAPLARCSPSLAVIRGAMSICSHFAGREAGDPESTDEGFSLIN